MLREFRPSDAARLRELMLRYFPAEGALLGYRPEEFDAIVRRLFRWHVRLVLAVANLVGRPIIKFFVLEADGQLAATTLLTFTERAGYVSLVSVDEAHRGRGYAKRLMGLAQTAARRAGREFIVLDVLTDNAPARHLYEQIGYRPLRSQSFLVSPLAPPAPGEPVVLPPGVRTFVKADAKRLAPVGNAALPEEVRRVLPVGPSNFYQPSATYGALGSTSEAWVVDRGQGTEAFLRATSSAAIVAGNVTAPILGPGVSDLDVQALLRTAGRWLALHGAPRSVSEVPHHNTRGMAALREAGYHESFGVETLYRPTRDG